MKVIFSSKHVIDTHCRHIGTQDWFRATWVYGTLYRSEKVAFWNWMGQHFGPCDLPWMCRGDFNEFLWDFEKSGGADMLYNRTRFLQHFMTGTDPLDLGSKG